MTKYENLRRSLYLENRYPREEHAVDGQDVDGGAHCQQQLELVDGAGDEAVESEAENLENQLCVVEQGESDLQPETKGKKNQ